MTEALNRKGIGLQLQQRRLELDLTIEAVAARTRIRKNYLLDLEAERFEGLPGEAYVLGFLRNYAKCLDLPAEALVELYKNGGAPDDSPSSDPPLSTTGSTPVRTDPPAESWTGFWVAFVIILLLGCGLYVLVELFNAPADPAPGDQPSAKLLRPAGEG